MSRGRPLACRLLGCRWRFRASGDDVVWSCARGCGSGGRRRCDSGAAARRLAAALNERLPEPPLGLLAALAGQVPDRRRRSSRGRS